MMTKCPKDIKKSIQFVLTSNGFQQDMISHFVHLCRIKFMKDTKHNISTSTNQKEKKRNIEELLLLDEDDNSRRFSNSLLFADDDKTKYKKIKVTAACMMWLLLQNNTWKVVGRSPNRVMDDGGYGSVVQKINNLKECTVYLHTHLIKLCQSLNMFCQENNLEGKTLFHL